MPPLLPVRSYASWYHRPRRRLAGVKETARPPRPPFCWKVKCYKIVCSVVNFRYGLRNTTIAIELSSRLGYRGYIACVVVFDTSGAVALYNSLWGDFRLLGCGYLVASCVVQYNILTIPWRASNTPNKLLYTENVFAVSTRSWPYLFCDLDTLCCKRECWRWSLSNDGFGTLETMDI